MTAIPDRKWVIGILVCAALSLAFAPVAFGPLGVIANALAKGIRRRYQNPQPASLYHHSPST